MLSAFAGLAYAERDIWCGYDPVILPRYGEVGVPIDARLLVAAQSSCGRDTLPITLIDDAGDEVWSDTLALESTREVFVLELPLLAAETGYDINSGQEAFTTGSTRAVAFTDAPAADVVSAARGRGGDVYGFEITPAEDPDGIGLIAVSRDDEILGITTTDQPAFHVYVLGPKSDDSQCFDVEQIGLSGSRATTEVCTDLVPKGCATAPGAGLAIVVGTLAIRRRRC